MMGANNQSRWRALFAARESVPDAFTWMIDGSGVLAVVCACLVAFVGGIAAGWSSLHLAVYAGFAVTFVGLFLLSNKPTPVGRWLYKMFGLYLFVMGVLGLTLLTLSGEPFIQPMVFTVPFVQAVINYRGVRAGLVGAFYLGLMELGLVLQRPDNVAVILIPVIAYGTLMVFMYAFTQMAVEQAIARRHTDQLAADLARQRDQMARLATATASLTHDLDLNTVLQHIATEGATLAQAEAALVWLHQMDAADDLPALRLAAAAPNVSDTNCTPPPPVEVAQVTINTMLLPLLLKHHALGVLELRGRTGASFAANDGQLLQPFADTAAVAIENARLYEQAQLTATLSERNRLARELHDTIAQGLTAVTMQLEAAQRSFDRDQERTRSRLARAHEIARDTLVDVRRSVWTLAAPVVDGHTLDAALDDLAQRFSERTGIAVTQQHDAGLVVDNTAAVQIVRIVQEALQNVEKHANASTVTLGSRTVVHGDGVQVWVQDNGSGFVVQAPPTVGANGSGFGLSSLHERAQLAGGTLQVASEPGMGTCVTFTLDGEWQRLAAISSH